MGSLINLEGKQFGSWSVIKRDPNSVKSHACWICQCICGKIQSVISQSLRTGTSSQCKFCSLYKGHRGLSASYWQAILHGAKRRGIKITVSIEDAWNQFDKQAERCALSGVSIRLIQHAGNNGLINQTASLDRVNSDEGYHEDNIQWIHKDVNKMKFDLDQDHFISLCKLISNHKS